jgi:hypothetical protein
VAPPNLILDARYQKVREAGVIESQTVLIAVGSDWKGGANPRRRAHQPGGSSWRDFLVGFKERGLAGVEFVASDGHVGLRQVIRGCCRKRFDAGLVPPGRVELPLPFGKQILSLPRLPIPPQGPGVVESRRAS